MQNKKEKMNENQLDAANNIAKRLSGLNEEKLRIETCLNSNGMIGIYLNTKNNRYDINLSALKDTDIRYLVELYLLHLKKEIESLKLQFEKI